LRTHFPLSETIDTFDAERPAQRFIVNPNGPDRHTLIAMRDAPSTIPTWSFFSTGVSLTRSGSRARVQ
jgi:hypothetical protein